MALLTPQGVGTLVADPETRFTTGGTAVTNARLAFNKPKYDERAGKWVDDKRLFLDVTVWDKQAEKFAEALRRGDRVYVALELTTDEWEDRATGAKRSKIIGTVTHHVPIPKGPARPAPAPAAADPWTAPSAADPGAWEDRDATDPPY